MNTKQPVIDPETALPQVEQMLFKLTWKFVNTYPISFEEARQEAYYAFVRSCYDFDVSKGAKFSTWCYYWVWTRLKDVVMQRSADPLTFVDMNEELVGAAPPERSPTLELIDDLSIDAKEIISLLLDTPKEILEGAPVPVKHLVGRVKRYLAEKGRDRKVLDLAVREIELRFHGAWN